MRILTTLLYPKSPPADGFVTRPGPPRPGRGGYAAYRFSGGRVCDCWL